MAPDLASMQNPSVDSKQPAGQVNGNGKEQSDEGFGFDKAGTGLAALTQPPKFDNVDEEREYLKERLVSALRIFAHLGYDHHVAGHLTIRDPDPNKHTFWVNPFGLAFRLMTIEDLIEVDEEGNVVGGGKPGRRIVNLAGFLIHSGIHKARPDVKAICHSHSPYGKAFSALGKELGIFTQDACTFYGDCAILREFGGVVIKGEESATIAKALGNKNSIILQNHGLLTCGSTIDAAVFRFIGLEVECRVNLLADAAAARPGGTQPVPIDKAQADFTFAQTGTERSAYFQASPYFQVIEALQGHEYLRKHQK